MLRQAKEERRRKMLNAMQSLLYLRLPGWDPEKTLRWMYPLVRWMFLPWAVTVAAVLVISSWLLLAVQLSSMMMKRIPRRWWRLIHLSSYGLFWAGLVHGATAGTDASNPVYIVGFSLLILVSVFLTAYRSLAVRSRRRPAVVPSS